MLEVRVVLTCLLQRMSHSVNSVGSAMQALKTLNHFQADIIFSDISMPEMDGYEFVRALRQRPDTRGRYIVAMTGNGEYSSEQASLSAGFDAHLIKPIKVDVLYQLLASPNLKSLKSEFE